MRFVDGDRLYAELQGDAAPRLEMSAIVVGAGLIAFASSAALLALGMSSMAVRYPLAVLVGWSAFLALVWAWVGHHRRRMERRLRSMETIEPLPDPSFASASPGGDDPVTEGGGAFGGGGASGYWDAAGPLDTPPATIVESKAGALDVDADDGFVLVVAAAAVIGVAYVVYVAPALLAELLLDTLLVSGLYRTLRRTEPRWWLATAVRRTSLPAVAVGVSAAVAGWAMQAIEPGASTIGALVRALG